MSNAKSQHARDASKRSASGGSALASTTAACGMVMLLGAAAVLASGEIGFRLPLLATAIAGLALVLVSARLRLTKLSSARRAALRSKPAHDPIELAVWKAD